MFKRILSPEIPEGFESQNQDKEVVDAEDEKQESSARQGALKITLHVLREMNQKDLADTLEKTDVIPSVMALKSLPNQSTDTDRGVRTCKSTLLEAVNKRFCGILSEPLYCVATKLDARYKDRYFDAHKKQGLGEMLQTQLDKMETDTVTASPRKRNHDKRGHG
ncbi:hypothetical protein J4Q44_G00181140 [Coregonus suidteri]|uniref:Uncharacterized protein n=1 Tax=Coregonus suidteri TaxID=861788 RepID=A0AAN8LJ42_9TELE